MSIRVRGDKPACPRGRHTGGGLVWWFWVWWYGVPYPLRKVMEVLAESPHLNIRAVEFDGCGCVKVLKDAVNDMV